MSVYSRHYARVLLTQARVFKARGDAFYRDLAYWAIRARNGNKAGLPRERPTGQMELPV